MNRPSERLINLLGALSLGIADRVRAAAFEETALGGEASAAIVVIGHAPGLSIDQLGQVLGLSHPGTVRLVDRLEGADLAQRSPAEHDRRAVALHLKRSGRAQCGAILNRRREAIVTVLKVVAPADRAVLERIVGDMLGVLPDSALSALTVCRFCDTRRCADCPMDVFGTIAD